MSFTFLRHLSVMIGILLLCPTNTTLGQEPIFKTKRIEFDEGLASRNINLFFENSEGFMWFGTNEGLNKYDAHGLELFNESNGLVSSYISQIAEDDQGLLWLYGEDPNFESQRVVQLFDAQTEQALHISDVFGDELPFNSAEIVKISSFLNGSTLWITVTNGSVYAYQNHTFKLIWSPQTASQGSELQYSIAGPESVWLFFQQEAISISKDSTQTIPYNKERHIDLGTVLVTADNTLAHLSQTYIETTGSSRLFLSINGKDLKYGDENFMDQKRFLAIDPYNKHLWMDSASRVVVYDFDLNKLVMSDHWIPLYTRPKLMTFSSSGVGWLNINEGVLMTYLETPKFNNYLIDLNVFDQQGYGARGMVVEENTLYSNGRGKSYKINLDNGKYHEFGPNTGFYNFIEQDAFKRLALIKDSNDDLWYTDEGYKVARYSKAQNKFTDYTYQKSTFEYFRQNGIDYSLHWSAFFDRNERLWLGRRRGLAYKEPDKDYLENFETYGNYPELRSAGIFDFYENNDGIWIAAETGLYLMTLTGEILKRYHQQGNSETKLPYNNIAHIREDKNNLLWLASRGGGIIQLDPETGEFKQWTTRQGLSNNTVYATFEDNSGYIWASSNKGIMRIRKSDFQVSTFLEGDGLNTEEFNTISHFQANDGRIFFGNIDGITVFNPQDFLIEQSEKRPIKVSKLEIQQKKTGLYENHTADFYSQESILLKPSELGFNLRLSMLDYKGGEYNRYSYLIEGFDGDWRYLSEPSLRVNALPYGSYNLRVRGQTSKGEWSKELNIQLVIIRPIYLRWWFILLVLILLSFSIFLIIQKRIKSLKERHEKLEEEVEKRTEQIRQQAEELKSMDKLKSRFFANVSHELRTPLTLILGPVSDLVKKPIPDDIKHDLLRVERNANSMSNLVEEILDLSKLEANQLSLNPETTLASQYFEVLFTNFLSQARLKEIDYNYEFIGDKQARVQLDQRIVGRIVTNLLSNAFKFTPSEGEIQLRVQLIESTIQVEVIDSGIGISKNDLPYIFERFFQTKETSKSVQGGTGIGLAMSKELAELMGGTLTVVSKEQVGTTFVFSLSVESSAKIKRAKRKIEQPEAEEIQTEEVGEWIHKSNLLIVEDNLDMQAYLKEVLSDFSAIEIAHHGKDGLKKLQNNKLPDIIISDMMMPEMDGLEFLETIRKDSSTYDIPLLMLTARSAEEDKMKAFTLGVDDYLLKPFSVDELKARLKNLLKNSESRKQAKLNQRNDEPIEPRENIERNVWLGELHEIVEKHVHEVDFNIATVAERIGLSERQLQRNLKKATGLTPVIYLKEIRLQMARNYLEKKEHNQVSSVSEAVGFTSTAYFSKLFKDRFGKLPSEYLN